MTAGFTARHARLVRALATGFIALAALLAAVWLAPRASGTRPALAPHPGGPPAHAARPRRRRPARGRRLRPGRVASAHARRRHALHHGRPHLRPARRAGAATVRLRTSLDGVAWSRWYRTLPLSGRRDRPRPGFHRAAVDGRARYVQVSAPAGPRRAPARLSGVRLVAIDPAGWLERRRRACGHPAPRAATVAGVDLASRRRRLAPPVIVTRAQWGADESLRSGLPPYSPVKMAFVHHTASGNDYTPADGPAIVRGIYAYHTQRPRLERHRLQLPHRPLRRHLRRPLRRRGPRASSGRRSTGFNPGSTGIS